MNARRIIAVVLFLACGGALWALNRRGAYGQITPRPLLYLVADTEREAERIPLSLTRVSDEKENQIGEDLARAEGLRNVPVSEQRPEYIRITQYLNRVGGGLTAYVNRPAIHYRFYYVPDNYFVNAAAMPGGQIVVGRGLLRLLDTEDELAAILGHEIVHVDARHSIERMQYEIKARQIGLAGIYELGAPAIQLFEAGYTKEQEADADRMGLTMAVAAGYSPQGAVDAMRRLQQLEARSGAPAESPVDEMAGVPIQALEEYFRSHPPTSDRITAFEKQIEDDRLDAKRSQRPMAIRTIFRTEQADALDRRGEFQKAVERYRDAIQDDATYAPARRGLVRTLWRSGDAAATIAAGKESLNVDSSDVQTWRIVARATAAENRSTAVETFTQIERANLPSVPSASAAMNVEEIGLAVFCNDHPDERAREYVGVLARASGVARQAELRIAMAGWMYRAGRLDEALKELEAAYQQSPSALDASVWRAWALSDSGRQADALAALTGSSIDPSEHDAVSALIHSRTEQRDLARQEFAAAAEADPVWMEPRWPANNYSAKAATVFAELRDSELARRKEEEAKKRRAAATGEAR